MNIGFYIQWPKGSFNWQGNVLGDELIGESMCRELRTMNGVEMCELFAPNHIPDLPLDVMIYMNETEPVKKWARRHVLYMQNAYGEGSGKALAKYVQRNYDGYAFISNRLLSMHRDRGYEGIFLPFGVDIDQFRPMPADEDYAFDVAYVGSDIKGEGRTVDYIYPATAFNFGLYGNWQIPKFRFRFRFWRNWQKLPPYKKEFEKLSRGKIPQELVPVLYSNAYINLNCTAQDCVDWDVVTLRTFEVLACRGFLITDRVPSAERELERCVVFTDGGNDLREKILYYLERPEERARIANNGYKYVIRNATITSRMNILLPYLKKIV